MLRTGRLLPPKRLSTMRFDAGRFPPAPAVCYRAPWRLPGTGLPPAGGCRLTGYAITSRSSSPPFLIACLAGHAVHVESGTTFNQCLHVIPLCLDVTAQGSLISWSL